MSAVDLANVLRQGIVTRATSLRGTDGALPEPNLVVLEGHDIARALWKGDPPYKVSSVHCHPRRLAGR